MIVVFYRSDGRGFVVWRRTRDEWHFPKCTGSGCFFLRILYQVGWMRSFCRDVCGWLERQSGTRFALPARYRKSMSCPTLAPTELVYVCTVKVLFPSRRAGIAPPPHFFF